MDEKKCFFCGEFAAYKIKMDKCEKELFLCFEHMNQLEEMLDRFINQ